MRLLSSRTRTPPPLPSAHRPRGIGIASRPDGEEFKGRDRAIKFTWSAISSALESTSCEITIVAHRLSKTENVYPCTHRRTHVRARKWHGGAARAKRRPRTGVVGVPVAPDRAPESVMWRSAARASLPAYVVVARGSAPFDGRIRFAPREPSTGMRDTESFRRLFLSAERGIWVLCGSLQIAKPRKSPLYVFILILLLYLNKTIF